MAQNILTGLCSVRPEQKVYFTQNYQQFVKKIDQTTAVLKAKTATVARKPFVSYANAFPYFYQFFGFKNLMAVELSCEQEISPKDMADAAKLMKAKQIKILVGDAAEPNEPDGLAKETNAKKILLWPTTDETGDYLKTLQHNVALLVKALQ
jgi:zinc transport system substrate-binding protein